MTEVMLGRMMMVDSGDDGGEVEVIRRVTVVTMVVKKVG